MGRSPGSRCCRGDEAGTGERAGPARGASLGRSASVAQPEQVVQGQGGGALWAELFESSAAGEAGEAGREVEAWTEQQVSEGRGQGGGAYRARPDEFSPGQ